jgi:serine/threonine-protein kinase
MRHNTLTGGGRRGTGAVNRDQLIGRVIHNRYRLEHRQGVGGMGAVYKARHLFLDRIAAIKIIQPEQRSQEHFRAWFLREARAVNMINHAHVVEIYDYGETEDGLAYLVMEFLDGIPLSTIVSRGPAPLAMTVDVLEQACAALARAHDLGVIHRDLKPDNIFLLERGGRKNFVKLLDFGLARVIREGRLAEKGAVFGTPEYISPEQARGEDAGPASDLYSLGVIFYELITGRIPFDDKDRDRLFSLHQHQPPPPPSQINPDVGPEEERIILRLLAKNPADRYRDSHHLLDDLKALQRVVPTSVLREVDDRGTDLDSDTAPAAPVTLPEFSQWAIKSAIFARMAARAFPTGGIPDEISSMLDALWQTTAAATMVDGELAEEARRLEKVEGKMRDIKAQLGRKVEELSREVSRLQREVESSQSVLERSRRRVLEVEEELQRERKAIDKLEEQGASAARLKEAYERTGAMHANFIARRQQVNEMEQAIINKREEMHRLEERIQTYRRELDGRTDALGKELSRARANIEEKGIEAARLRKALVEAASFLTERLYPIEECRELFEELERLTGRA